MMTVCGFFCRAPTNWRSNSEQNDSKEVGNEEETVRDDAGKTLAAAALEIKCQFHPPASKASRGVY